MTTATNGTTPNGTTPNGTATNGSTFVPGLEGVVAFHTTIAEPDRDGGSLRYRGCMRRKDLEAQREEEARALAEKLKRAEEARKTKASEAPDERPFKPALTRTDSEAAGTGSSADRRDAAGRGCPAG